MKAIHQGLILDYLLLSEEFAQQNAQQRGKITNLVVWDKHLVNPSFEVDQFASDHAAYIATRFKSDAQFYVGSIQRPVCSVSLKH